MIFGRVLVVVLSFAASAVAQSRISAEAPLDLASDMRFVWPHPAGDREVNVSIDRDGGPCVVRVGRQRVEEVDVSGVYFDEEQHVAGGCFGHVTLVDDGDLVVEIATTFGDAGDPGGSTLLLLTRDAWGNALVLTRGSRDERENRWYTGHGSDAAIARARASCESAEGETIERVWERLDMLRATAGERGACAARYAENAMAATCAGREPALEMECWYARAQRLASLAQRPTLAEHASSLRDASRGADQRAVRAALRALAALPPLTAEDPAEFLARTRSLDVYSDDNRPLLELLGLEVEAAWLARDGDAAGVLLRCLAATDASAAATFRRELANADPTLLSRCEAHLTSRIEAAP